MSPWQLGADKDLIMGDDLAVVRHVFVLLGRFHFISNDL